MREMRVSEVTALQAKELVAFAIVPQGFRKDQSRENNDPGKTQ